jgi:hypothetical protein
MTKTLRPDTIQSSRPIIAVRLEGTNKLLVLVHAQGIAEPLVITQHLVNGLYLPHYREQDPRTSTIIRNLASLITVYISHQHNILSATVDLPKGSKGLRSGYAQCISMEDALKALQERMPFGGHDTGKRLPMINGDYPDAGYAMRVIEYLQRQLQPKDEGTKAVQMTLPVTKAMPFRVMSREQVDELLSARDAKMMAIRDAKAKAHHAEEAVRIAQQSAAAHTNAVKVLESELEKIIVLLQGGEA